MIVERISFIGPSFNTEKVRKPGYINVWLADAMNTKMEVYPEGTGKKFVLKDLASKGHNVGF